MSKKDLAQKEAIQKLKELAENIDFAMMETNLGGRPSHIIPMSTKDVDELGCIWFLSNKNSEHNTNIEKDNKIQLIYSKPGTMEFLTVFGSAVIYSDKNIIAKYYSKFDDVWFDGPNDPNITALKIIPSEAHYWDTKNGKMITFFKMMVGVITGKEQDLSEHGNLQI